VYEQRPHLETRTKIVATLGPACWEEPTLTQILETGVDVARINCSHADHESIRRQVARVRRAAMRLNKPTAILLDLQGPKIRTGKVPEPLPLQTGDILTIVMDPDVVGHGKTVGTTYPEMVDDVTLGDLVLFADGALSGVVAAIRKGSPGEVDIRMTHGAPLGSHKGINLPGVELSVPCLTEKDLADLAVGIEVGVDYVALSFVQRARDITDLKAELARLGAPNVPVIAKIEKPQAVDCIDAILAVAEGVMVARGDLGVEVSIEKVPVYQKRIIAAAHKHGRLCITATQMLDSMERNPRPTRAETTDVANAILDGTDAVMLSGETSVGDYPILAVQMMDKIAREVEASSFFTPTPLEQMVWLKGRDGLVVRSACWAASELGCPLVVFSWSGHTARGASKTRPKGAIFALTSNPQTADRLALAWGVTPVLVPTVDSIDDVIELGAKVLLARGMVQEGEDLMILAGPSPVAETANLMKLHRAGS
jgi:pyruvate kinase